MSYILDALKKLENEKLKKNHSAGMINIAGELLREDHRRPSGSSNVPKIVVAALVASLITFGITYLFLQAGKEGDASKLHTTSPAAPIKERSHRLPPPEPLPHQAAAPQPEPAGNVATGHPSISQKRPERRPAHNDLLSLSRRQERSITPAAPPRTDINVSGIAWQDERRARRAVVNGYLMHEQSVVSGAKIIEILPNRVLFSQSGNIFEIPLVAPGLPEAGK